MVYTDFYAPLLVTLYTTLEHLLSNAHAGVCLGTSTYLSFLIRFGIKESLL